MNLPEEQVQYGESADDWDDSLLSGFEKELIAAMSIAMGALSDTREGLRGLRKMKETLRTQPSFIIEVIKTLNHYGHVLLTLATSGERKLELSNGWDIDTRETAGLLIEGGRVFTQLQEGKLIV